MSTDKPKVTVIPTELAKACVGRLSESYDAALHSLTFPEPAEYVEVTPDQWREAAAAYACNRAVDRAVYHYLLYRNPKRGQPASPTHQGDQ